MTEHASHHATNPPGLDGEEPPDAGPRLRVIAMRVHDAEQQLRRDPNVELVRARTLVEAIGELGLPIDETSPRRTAVVVAGADVPEDDGGAFCSALRRVEPRVRVVAVAAAQNGHGPRVRHSGWADAVVDEPIDADALRAALGLGVDESDAANPEPPCPAEPSAHTPPPAPAPAAPGEAEPAATTAGEPAPAQRQDADRSGPVDDSIAVALLDCLLRGTDPVRAALDLLVPNADRGGVQYVPRTASASPPRAGEGRRALPLVRGGSTAGWILGPDAAIDALETHGPVLAAAAAADAQHRELRSAAFQDPITGAWNRRYFDRAFAAAVQDAADARREFAVLLFDIDDFKRFNDTYGHAAGDEILRETVRLLRSTTRPGDKVCRIGGDEFAVLFTGAGAPREPGSRSPAAISEITDRFRAAIHSHRFPKLGTDAIGRLTVSGGLATFPWDGSTPETLLDHADRLLLESKCSGKNAIRFGPCGHPAGDGG